MQHHGQTFAHARAVRQRSRRTSMDRFHYGQKFEKSRNRKFYYHGIEEHPEISKIAKFGCETL